MPLPSWHPNATRMAAAPAALDSCPSITDEEERELLSDPGFDAALKASQEQASHPDTELDPATLRLLGFDLVPLHRWTYSATGTRGRRIDGKTPCDKAWPSRTYTPDEIDAHVASGGNLGGRMGGGRIALDWDPRNDPTGDSLERACRDYGIPRTLETATPSGGAHVHLRVPAGVRLRDNLAELGYPGIEVKGQGRQVVLPGSRHPRHLTGELYRWAPHVPPILDFIEVPEAPPAFVEAARLPERKPRNTTPADPNELARIREALEQLDPSKFTGYHEWLHLGMEIHDGTGGSAEGLDAWMEFCARIPGYADGAEECAEKWDTFGEGRGRTVASLYDRVKKAGGTIPAPTVEPPEEDFADEPVEPKYVPREVMLTGRQRDEIAADIVDAVAAWNVPPRLFRRAGRVVLAYVDERGAPALREQTPARFLDVTARAARFYTRRHTDDGWKRIDAKLPQAEAGVALERLTTDTVLPPLLGMAEAPVMRPDGSILDRPGYDEATGLYAAFQPIRLEVPERPTPAQVAAARDLLLELVWDYPFVNQASRANALAALLTLPLRPLFPLVPLILFTAAMAGTGKSLLVRTLAAVALGREPHELSLPDDEEELRKTIVSLCRKGAGLVWLDNIDRPLESASLCALLTSNRVEGRILGVSEMVELEHASTWFATGNNVEVRRDLVRRTVWSQLDAEMPNPEERTGFRHELPAWALAERPRLLSAVFTLARAWIAAGRPAPTGVPSVGNFGEWVRVVGGTLEVAGIHGFLGNWAEQRAALDDAVPAWAAFLAAWAKALPGPVTAKRLAQSAAADPVLRDAIPDELGDPEDRGFTTRLGHALKKRAGQRFTLAGGRVVWAEKVQGSDHEGGGAAALWRARVQG